MPTQYDQKNIDPPARAATLMMVVADPLAEPRIHRCFPAGLDELWIYTQEVVAGVHDHWVGEKGWSYSYHDRLTNWPGGLPPDHQNNLARLISGNYDQIEQMLCNLAAVPFTRRAQAVTWVPFVDGTHHEPPCLQRTWCQMLPDEETGGYFLEMNTNWRSRDIFKAAFMNIYAITEWQKIMAQDLSVRTGKPVRPGRYIDMTDNAHLYGSYYRRGEIDGFLGAVSRKTINQLTWRSDSEKVQGQFEIGRQKLCLPNQ